MADKLVLDGLTVAPNVITTIVSIATTSVEGVASIYAPTLRKAQGGRGIEITTNEQGQLEISVHVQVFFGAKLRELGEAIQNGIADALSVQLGVTPAHIDIFIDSLVFAE